MGGDRELLGIKQAWKWRTSPITKWKEVLLSKLKSDTVSWLIGNQVEGFPLICLFVTEEKGVILFLAYKNFVPESPGVVLPMVLYLIRTQGCNPHLNKLLHSG